MTRPLARSAAPAPIIHAGDRTHHQDQPTTPASLSAMNAAMVAPGRQPMTSEAFLGR
ncbi:MAG TPA: hypothetical protein VHZ33_09575 [Trebonia sp.]|nr:hypothetical protein [Trebonia sp.]